MSDKQNITIRIADLAPIPLAIKRADEEIYRTAEYNVNQLYSVWKARYSDRSPKEVLAMVAFQFAKLYTSQLASIKETENFLGDFEQELDRLLFDTDGDRTTDV